MQFSSDPGLHASIVSPTYWWHSERPAQCLVQFQSQTIKVGHDNTPYVNILPPLGRLDLSVYGFDDILWKSSFSKLAFRSRHKQHFFSMATSGPFQLLLNASSVHRGIAITVEGISVHCCPGMSMLWIVLWVLCHLLAMQVFRAMSFLKFISAHAHTHTNEHTHVHKHTHTLDLGTPITVGGDSSSRAELLVALNVARSSKIPAAATLEHPALYRCRIYVFKVGPLIPLVDSRVRGSHTK